MLLSDDKYLVDRDIYLPGLADVMNKDLMISRLTTELGLGGLRLGFQQTYIRYKPKTSCLIGYTGQCEDKELYFYSSLYNRVNRDKARKPLSKAKSPSFFGPAGFFIEELNVLFMLFPNDHELRQLPYILNFQKHSERLRNWLPFLNESAMVNINCIRYKPERRFVGKAKLFDGQSVLIKAHARHHKQSFYPSQLESQADRSFLIPKKICYSDKHKLDAYPWISGITLMDIMARDPDLVIKAGRCLADFHSQTLNLNHPGNNSSWNNQTILKIANAAIKIVPEFENDISSIANYIIHHPLLKHVNTNIAQCLIHGDFSADQIIVGSDGLWLIDFDRSRFDSPLYDLGCFIARLEFNTLDNCNQSDINYLELADKLIEGYEQGSSLSIQPLIRIYVVIQLLCLVTEPFRLRRSNWLTQTKNIIIRIKSIVSSFGHRYA